MLFIDYEEFTEKLAFYPNKGEGNFVYPTLGLCGEAGEFAEHVKKAIRNDGGVITDERKIEMKLELGDVLWYLTRLAKELGSSLSEIASLNMAKLEKRHAKGIVIG